MPLISFRPSASIQAALAVRKMVVQRIENGIGPLNLDNYQVEVDTPPRWAGADVPAEKLFAFFRKNINLFMERKTCHFSPFDNSDAPLWISDAPAGAVIHIDMLDKKFNNMEDGSVVCAESSAAHWIFSTIEAPGDFTHPVSGNREFGYFIRNENPVFYTMGADRVCGAMAIAALGETIFSKAHATWLGMQRRFISYIEHNGGRAKLVSSHSMRVDWEAARKLHFHPKAAWLDPARSLDFRPMAGSW